jgi:hypothetical protein
MSDETRESDDQPRAPYEPPTLAVIAVVSELTLGTTEIGSDAGSMFS